MPLNLQDIIKLGLVGSGSGGSSGGGGGSSGGGAATVFGRTVETGTFTCASAQSSVRIWHSLGTIPTGAIWWTEADAYADNSQDYPLMGCAIYYDDANWYGLKTMIKKGSASTTTSVSASGHYKTKSGNTSMFGAPNSGAAMGATVFNNANAESVDFYAYPMFPAGVEFKYMLLGGLPK
jgi:hypothetical protein